MNRHFTALALTSLVASSACGLDLTTPSSDGEEDILVAGLVDELAWLAGEWTLDTGICSHGGMMKPPGAVVLGMTSGGEATLAVGRVVHQHRFVSGVVEGLCACWTGTGHYRQIRFSPEIEITGAPTTSGRYLVRDFVVRGGGDDLVLSGSDTQFRCELTLSFHRS